MYQVFHQWVTCKVSVIGDSTIRTYTRRVEDNLCVCVFFLDSATTNTSTWSGYWCKWLLYAGPRISKLLNTSQMRTVHLASRSYFWLFFSRFSFKSATEYAHKSSSWSFWGASNMNAITDIHVNSSHMYNPARKGPNHQLRPPTQDAHPKYDHLGYCKDTHDHG